MSTRYAWSTEPHGEYHGSYRHRLLALQAGRQSEGDDATIYTCVRQPVAIDHQLSAADVIDRINENDGSSDGGVLLIEAAVEEERELDAMLDATIQAWLDKNPTVLREDAFEVAAVRAHFPDEVTEDEDDEEDEDLPDDDNSDEEEEEEEEEQDEDDGRDGPDDEETPEDPDYPRARNCQYCGREHGGTGYVCTRPAGHTGLHVAHGANAGYEIVELVRWEDPPRQPPAPAKFDALDVLLQEVGKNLTALSERLLYPVDRMTYSTATKGPIVYVERTSPKKDG